MDTLDEVQRAIERLPYSERERLSAWLSDEMDTHGVREAAPLYHAESELRRLTFEEYLAFEEASAIRHEFVDGIVYAMSGGTENHELIAANVLAAIHPHLDGGPCRAYVANFKVRIDINEKVFSYFPDVMVSCTRDGAERSLLRYPTLVVEVLSPSTQAIDKREKRLNYTQIATLQEYVLIAQDVPEILIYRRSEEWAPQRILGLESSISLSSINLSLPLPRIYKNTNLITQPTDQTPSGAPPR